MGPVAAFLALEKTDMVLQQKKKKKRQLIFLAPLVSSPQVLQLFLSVFFFFKLYTHFQNVLHKTTSYI